MFEIHNGDCAEVMASMEANSVDAIVTDPPYGLSFMGKELDSPQMMGSAAFLKSGGGYGNYPKGTRRTGYADVDPHRFQAYMTPIFEEALRVAKPGAHMLCFGGTRTFHRLTCAIEDAGWEIRDCIMWTYGCLDEETEVLVDGEFVPYNKAKIGSLALGYDIERGTFSWQRIEDTYLYDYDDTAYAIQSDSTDQLVSRNHRCIVERGGVEQFAFAEQVALEREACVPVLESLHGLLDRLPLPYKGASNKEQDVLEGMRGKGGEPSTEGAQDIRAEHDMPSMREKVLRADGMEAQGEGELLLGKLQEQGQVRSDAGGVQQGTPDANVGGTEAASQRNDGWGTEPVVEGRHHVSPQSRELQGREVRQMPEGVLGDGTQGRIRDGAQARGGSGDREAVNEAGVRASHQPRPTGQQTREPDVVPVECGAQDLRELWGAKSTLARVTPVHYEGKMWCIKVATGAFIARRHGKIFITGNSGFPKSMDVGKAIDKALGAERPVVGHSDHGSGPWQGKLANHGRGDTGIGIFDGSGRSFDITAPATDAAAQWDGWGTCLKPAWEPIIVARKPLDGTVANNVLTWGVGALNIDGCRVPYEDGGTAATNPLVRELGGYANNHNPDTGGTSWSVNPNGKSAHANTVGRFPANLVHDGSQMVLDLFPDTGKSSGGGMHTRGTAGEETTNTYGSYTGGMATKSVGVGDSGSAARFFYCAKASKKERGDGNNHPTVKPIALMKWLVTLVTPEGGVVLDPFAGSGTTLVACKELGRDCIGIERESEYVEIIKRRLGEE